jgi:predicted porin
MNKKLLAAAVAGALALPGVALAQSSVTISGFLKASFDNIKYSGVTPGRANNSETRVTDNSSRIIFNVVEDLGGGLAAIAQIDWRVTQDAGADAIGGNNHVGLRSKTWGRVFIGRQDVHYFNRESDLTGKGDLRADSISLLAYAGGGKVAIANATRVPNIIHYTTPNWGGFTVIAAYSTNPAAQDADIAAAAGANRKGRAWHLNPNFAGANWQVGYSYYSGKFDAPGAAIAGADQRGDRLYGSYRWGGFKIGAAWDKSKLKTAAGATAGATVSDRTAWSIPLSYTWGAHEIHGHYTKARDDKATAAVQDGAKMWALAYAYNLSKRTSAAVTYAKLNNDTGAAYDLFTNNSGLASAAAGATVAGEDTRLLSFTLRHAF